MVITRDQKAQHSFGELMEEEFTSASECSRASTPATSACSTPAQSEATTPANVIYTHCLSQFNSY